MSPLLSLLLSSVVLVADGQARVRLEHDGSETAMLAVRALQRQVVLLTGAALPEIGAAPVLRFELTTGPGYRVVTRDQGTVIEGRDLLRAVQDALDGWGAERRATLELELSDWRPNRTLWIEADRFDPSYPATGLSVRGVRTYDAALAQSVHRAGYEIRVCSTTFDDFLSPDRFADHPEWFALRNGERVARGNFALTNADARAAYLESVAAWIELHPEVDAIGIWPEVTTVWCEESAALGHAEAYALLWREAAKRFPDRTFEVLATGLTLRPPKGSVPANVQVRFRPGQAASALQGIAGQEIEAVARAWEARGAKVLLEIDGSPESWVGMPWPCQAAVRADARRFRAAVLRHPRKDLARIWRDPERTPVTDPATRLLLDRARNLRSWGHPRDAATLFLEEEFGLAHDIASLESALERADPRPAAVETLYSRYRRILETLPARQAKIYQRYRGREVERTIRKLRPDGVEIQVGPAKVRDSFERLTVETDRLRLGIDRASATVDAVQLRRGKEWTPDLSGAEGAFFSVVALGAQGEPGLGSVRVSSPESGVLHIELTGRYGAGGTTWTSLLTLESASGTVRQTAQISSDGGIALASQCGDEAFDHWVCPPYAMEGGLGSGGRMPALGMPPKTLIYLRKGDRGAGLALRLPFGATIRLSGKLLIATTFRNKLAVDWILFSGLGELGH